jgi:lipopolysaccharide transport system ATP-binding protein
MSDIAVRIEHVSKRYRLGERESYGALRDLISGGVSRALQRARAGVRRQPEHPEEDSDASRYLWALRDVSLDVRQGEIVGIIGSNGAGKSTLLKILARVTYPTTGRGVIHGRFGSLLEVGSGFHPELTGRENVYLNGTILGMRKAEIERHYASIVEFAELERFMETPVKRYSSGMYMRLAFAVAAHLDADVLLVDEVLAVGDAAFQQKSLRKMGDVARSGRTVLFVSHNMLAVQDLCERVIWIRDGSVVADGASTRIVSDYLGTQHAVLPARSWIGDHAAPGNERVRLRRAAVAPAVGDPSAPLTIRTPLVVDVEYMGLAGDLSLRTVLYLFNAQGAKLFVIGSEAVSAQTEPPAPHVVRDRCYIPADLLNDGAYRIGVEISDQFGRVVYSDAALLMFHLLDSADLRSGWYGKWDGVIRPRLRWERSVEAVEVGELAAARS